MPIYEYRCQNGHAFEVRQGFTDDPMTKCEVCGAPVARVFRAPAVHFKGSGFYNTDYGTRKRSRENESHEAAKSKDAKDAKAAKAAKESAGKSSSDSSSDSGGGSKSSDSGASKSSDSGAKRSETKAPARD